VEIVSMPKMKLPSSTAILFNGAALLVAGASLVVVVRSFLFSESVAPCQERYHQGMRFSLDRNGEPMAAADLQSRLNNTDWGLNEGTRVVKLKSGPGKHALEIDLATAAAPGSVDGSEKRPGVGFTWTPQGFAAQRAACLSYAVYLPDDFAFGKGGRLPGLIGSDVGAAETDGQPATFSTRYTWGPGGAGNVLVQNPTSPEGRAIAGANDTFPLPRGRWMALEQEVVLNTPGEKNGVLRVWLDGSLVLNRTGMVLPTKPSMQVTGVLAETVAGEQPAGTKPGDRKIWLTPFELRWQ
jgi:hypothetical protein